MPETRSNTARKAPSRAGRDTDDEQATWDLPGPEPGSPDDFDPVAKFYDLTPVPTHPKRLRPLLNGVEGPVLDLGGGTGKYTVRIFENHDGPVLVVDPSRKMLQKGRKKKRPFFAIESVGEALPIADGSLGAIVITEAFHHLGEGQESTLEEAARVLRSDGVLLIEEPDPSRFVGRVFAWAERFQKMSSVFQTPARLQAALEKHFEEVRTMRASWITYVAEARRHR